MTPNLTDKKHHAGGENDGPQNLAFEGQPATDSDSKSVLIVAERNDLIEITNIVFQIEPEAVVPLELSVIDRRERYYGPELLLHSEIDGVDRNFLLTAPGPTSQLRLWIAKRRDGTYRNGWIAAAEVQAALAAEQPPYEICEQCGDEIRTIEHERMSVLGRCQR